MNLGYFGEQTLVAMYNDCRHIAERESNKAEVRDHARNLAYVIEAELSSRDSCYVPNGWRFH